MAKINIIRNTYGGVEYLLNALAYVSDDRALYRGGYGVNPYDYTKAYNQMLIVRQWFNKVSGNPLVHIVIAYNDKVKELAVAAEYGKKCAMYFAGKYQVLYCTHLKDTTCGSMHTHIIINAVSYQNGQMITTGYNEIFFFCEYVAKVTGQKCSFEFDNKAIYSD
ncbi:MAG: relaxase/mobilization nuclease domain-containing protein [Ruminococcus sp.]|nr:relaxase/mobilization nuclease domain-containing protein [Ruminococcus sp.]